jgi:hypothetical protein
MSTLPPTQFSCVIPAKAGSHGNLQQAVSQHGTTPVATFPIPIHAAQALVGPGLRRDDDCGEACPDIPRKARGRIRAALVAALLTANPALADSSSVCISATNLLKIAEPSWRQINDDESDLLKGYVSGKDLRTGEIVAFEVSDAFVLFRYANLSDPIQQVTGSTILFVQQASQKRIVNIKFSTLTFNPGDVMRDCNNAPNNYCLTESWSFDTRWNNYSFGLSRNLSQNRQVDKVIESSGLGSGCDPNDDQEQLKFWTTFLAKPKTLKPTP